MTRGHPPICAFMEGDQGAAECPVWWCQSEHWGLVPSHLRTHLSFYIKSSSLESFCTILALLSVGQTLQYCCTKHSLFSFTLFGLSRVFASDFQTCCSWVLRHISVNFQSVYSRFESSHENWFGTTQPGFARNIFAIWYSHQINMTCSTRHVVITHVKCSARSGFSPIPIASGSVKHNWWYLGVVNPWEIVLLLPQSFLTEWQTCKHSVSAKCFHI